MSADTESLACTYAALMLHDAGAPVTADTITAAVTAAGVTVRPTLPILFARFLEKKSIHELMSSAAAAAPSAAAAAAPAGGAAPAAAAAAPAAGKKAAQKEESESDGDIGFGLFD